MEVLLKKDNGQTQQMMQSSSEYLKKKFSTIEGHGHDFNGLKIGTAWNDWKPAKEIEKCYSFGSKGFLFCI